MTRSPTQELLLSHREITAQLYGEGGGDPHNPLLYLQRGHIHACLGFADLAAADAYRALTLLESVVDPEGCEYVARRRRHPCDSSSSGDAAKEAENREKEDDDAEEEDEEDDTFIPISREEYDAHIGEVYLLLVRGLRRCGCLRDAYEFCVRGVEHLKQLNLDSNESQQQQSQSQSQLENGQNAVSLLEGEMEEIKRVHRRKKKKNDNEDDDDDDEFNPHTLTAQGLARRVLYPWNDHEPDRKAPETLQLLNERLKHVAPKCEVRAVALPALHDTGRNTDDKEDDAGDAAADKERVSIQLGLFAKEDIQPGEVLLRESSLLTATNRLHDDLCDACNGPLPELSSDGTNTTSAVACENCDDTIFCSQACHDRAQEVYHRAVCGHDGLESIGRDVPDPKDKADYLYLLLLGRAMAMATTQDVHPLDLPEVKYIWGDFHDFNLDEYCAGAELDDDHDPTASLPFSFQLNILQPTRLLEEMGLDPFISLARFDTWVLNTLYAKFRGTASGRLSTWDGGPEVCAVHPLWCLANHSCDPNVRWEWGGEITFVARTQEEKAVWRGKNQQKKEGNTAAGGGIKKDEEILNHYCDVNLDVAQRREWARGALGGMCRCPRCVWESSCS
ncbi:hypothetical protein VTN77DRAFT_4125 [Rasamsonia byssochlamydoides]|uniref:uncharacterized protein n=1 Tax=Rasamsonia byssochlamydoides TaxID=89139 RepID=UPI003743834E